MKDKFMKNGVFSLEYDKETLRDMVLELQEENEQLQDNWNKLKEYIETIYKGCPVYEKEVVMFIIDKMQELEGKQK